MKCCKKTVLAAVAVAIGLVLVSRTSWGEYGWTKVKSAFKAHISPEMQIERMAQEISKLDGQIDKGWTLVAQREKELEKLKKDIQTTQAYLEQKKADMSAAATDLEAGVKFVNYNGAKISDKAARRQLQDDVRIYEAKKKTLTSQEKLLESLEREYVAVKANQAELVNAKQQLADRLASIKADLETLKVAETRSKYPAGNNKHLNDIKATLNELEEEIGVRMLAQQLREDHAAKQSGTAILNPKEAEVANDEVVRKVRAAIGQNNEARNGD
jgi:chromosome segregation ATPase